MKTSLILCLLLLTISTIESYAQVSFSSSGTTSVGALPSSIVLADVNQDGRLDLLTANTNAASISVRLGDGAGNFTGTTEISVGSGPVQLVLADVNRDGRLDVLTVNSGSGTVSVRLGDGTGNFTGTTEVSAGGSNPQGLAVGDVNSDGRPDIIMSNQFSSSVSVRLGDGAGGFIGTTEVGVASAPQGVALADINLDGRLDIMAASVGLGAVSYRVGDGAGGFSGSTNYNVGGGGTLPRSVIIQDINSDGKPDILTSNLISNNISVRVSNGVATYNPLVTFSMGIDPSFGLAVSDINLDGKSDILTANQGSNTVSFRLGDGLGSFGGEQTIAVGASPRGIATGDINNDGRPDIVVTNSADNTVSVLLNTTAITVNEFGTPTLVSSGTLPFNIQTADVNKDGNLDLIVTNSISGSGTVSVRLGDGLGGFSGSTAIAVGSAPRSLALADVNLDGNLDFLAVNPGSASVSVRLGNGAGSFSGTTEVSVGTGSNGLAVGDINLDGFPDLLASTAFGNFVAVRLGDGMGNFSGTTSISVGNSPLRITIADVNLDGRPDFLTANAAGNSVSVRLGDGTANFAGGSTEIPVGNGPSDVFVSDFNLDGKPDIVTANTSSNSASIRLGDGSGGFSGTTNVSVQSSPTYVRVTDINLDGKPDLLVSNFSSSTISVRFGNGLGAFTGTTNLTVGTNPQSLAIGDFDKDGKTDFATANYNGANISVVLNNVLSDYSGNPSGITSGIFNNVTFTAGTLPLSTSFGVNATLTLNGNVELNGNTITVNNTATGAVTGTGSLFGSGSLVRAFNGDVSYSFPFLEGSNNRSATVAFTSGTGTGTLAYQFFNTPPGDAGLPQTLVGQSISVVAPYFWRIDATGTPGTYTLSLSGENTPGVTNVSTLRIAKRAIAGSWSSADAGTGNANAGTLANPTVVQSGIVGFGEFTIGGMGGGDNPLPVTLNGFRGSVANGSVSLSWKTISEQNNIGFIVLRNGVEIASYRDNTALRGNGTTLLEHTYSFADRQIEAGATYQYALRSVDLDGIVHLYPDVVTVEVKPGDLLPTDYALMQNYPNPFNPTTTIRYDLPVASAVSLKVYDVLGREVMTLVNQRQDAGVQSVTFNAGGLASGMYFYRLETARFVQTKKMMLVK